ncbi:MAG: hypothetical protein K8F59_12545 [Rhodobacteraceae bacterium]|nr:hypothetical protein [Paracoccaceae bacterium]
MSSKPERDTTRAGRQAGGAPVTLAELAAKLADIMAAPKDAAPVETLCLRPNYGQRDFVEEITVTRANGMPGERWNTAPWMRLADGSPDPRIQVSILGRRVMDAVWRDRENTPHPGDPIIADIDTSEANMPTGQLLAIGSAVLRVSDVFNDACVKWKTRYGKDAKDWIVLPENIPLRLRGVLCEVVQDGRIRLGDPIRKV